MATARNVVRLPSAAEQLVERCWRLFPCVPRDKKPLVKDWPGRATSEPATIRAWQEQYPTCNWAVACGPESRVWVLDVDGAEGLATVDTLCREHGGEWLNTLSAVTARGRHFYYEYSSQDVVKTCVRQLGPGLDIRGSGGYVLVPPSVHPSGQQYRWLDPDVPVASAPSWLLATVTSAKRVPIPAVPIGILPEGQRNDGLTRLAGSLRRKGASQEQIESELLAANMRRCKPPLDDAEVRKIAASVARYPAGGPDPLDSAWGRVDLAKHASRYEAFLELARQLQVPRLKQSIALPLKRIAMLLNCHFNLIARYRHRAVKEGRLTPVTPYIPHRRATQFVYHDAAVELNHVSSGLVPHPAPVPSYTPSKEAPSSTPDVEVQADKESVMIEGRI